MIEGTEKKLKNMKQKAKYNTSPRTRTQEHLTIETTKTNMNAYKTNTAMI